MDPEVTFIRVQERFSQMLTPRIRTVLEYAYLFIAITLFCILVVLHANYVQQPGCSSEFSAAKSMEAQILQIRINSSGLWSINDAEAMLSNGPESPDRRMLLKNEELALLDPNKYSSIAERFWYSMGGLSVRKSKVWFKFWKTDPERSENFQKTSSVVEAKETVRVALTMFRKKWLKRLEFVWNLSVKRTGIIQKLWNITRIHLDLDVPKWLKLLYLDKINNYAVHWVEKKTKPFDPTYFYTTEKGFFLLSEEVKSRHNIKTSNLSISAWHSCFGNRWQQLLINRMVGYDTILMNSLLISPGKGGYLYNFHTKEFYNLSYGTEPYNGHAKFGDYLATKCGVLMMSLFVFFTTTLSVSFTLRETQTRMLKFTVQLQHHARHRLPTFQLIFVHVVESLVFVPIMVGILFFLFELYDDQLLAFMVLILVWLCELFTLISVRTPISMKYFPRFFLLYFLVFHIYFFSYAYGFSYLALSTTAAFMQHLILYFWNRFEVPVLQITRRSHLRQQPDFHITSSTILASTFHITRLHTRSHEAEPAGRSGAQPPRNPTASRDEGSPAEDGGDSGSMNWFSSLLLWILGGAYSESFSAFLSIFRHVRDQNSFSPQNQQPHAD